MIEDTQNDPQQDTGIGNPQAERAPGGRRVKQHACGRPKVDGSGPCPAPVTHPGQPCAFHDDSPEGRARMEQARRQGGLAPRVGLNLPATAVDAIELATLEGRTALRTAVAKALATGRLTAGVAAALESIIKGAAADQQSDLGDLVDKQSRVIAQLRDGMPVR